jgi:tetratricopeptide (TPR) repeat protein
MSATHPGRSPRRRAAAGALLLSAAALLLPRPPAARAQAMTPEDAIVLIRTTNSLRSARGSGFIIGDGSWVVTASHVVSVDLGKGKRANDQTALVYSPWTGRPYEAKVVAIDGVADIALLKMPMPGFPALPVEGLDVTDAQAALSALSNRPLRLYGFPLSYGEDTVAALAKAEHNDSKLREIAKRGETSLCVLNKCPDVQPGWSGGPVFSIDKGAVVGVFHSLYKPKAGVDEAYPAGSVAGYLGDLLRTARADMAVFSHPPAPTLVRAPGAAERMAHEMRSLSWGAAGNWKKAAEEQQEILKGAPDDAMPHIELGRLLLNQQQYPEALKELREAVRLAPTSMLAHLYLARVLHLSYESKEAIATLQKALELSPGEVEPQLALAELYEANQQPEQAEAALRAALKSAPSHPGAISHLGTLLVRQHQPEEGMKLLAQASELSLVDPGLSFIALGYARALDTARKYKEAETAYRSIVRVAPENAHAHFYLAQLLLRLNRVEEAQLQLNAGIALPNISDEMLEAFRTLQTRLNERGLGN